MATAQFGAVRRIIGQVGARVAPDHGDGELLHRWNRERDQSAFTTLVRRHGPMVLGVCRRVLRDAHAADDAFQATFLVLAKKAQTVRPPGVLGPWLYGVAYRTALKARGRAFRRQAVERDYAEQASRGTSAPRSDSGEDVVSPLIDEQLNALPEKYRRPLVLCGMQGLGKAEAARRLGLPEGTVSSRLARAREMLRDRLARRGVVVPAATLAAFLVPASVRAAVRPAVVAATAEVAVGLAPISPTVLALSHEVLKAMTLVKWNLLSAVAVAVALTGGGFGLYAANADDKKPGDKPAATKPDQPKPDTAKPDAVKPVKPTDKPDAPKPDAVKPDQPKPDKPKPDAVKPDQPKPDKPKPDGNKPDKPKPEGDRAPTIKVGGQIGAVDVNARAITVTTKGENGPTEKVVRLSADAKVFIDNKPGELKDVPKGSFAGFGGATAKEGQPVEATEVRVTGPAVSGLVVVVDASSITINAGKEGSPIPIVIKVTPETKAQIGKNGKLSDLQPGDKVTAVLTTDQSSALQISGGFKGDKPPGDKKPEGEKKPEKPDGDE
jgi:RNA polymerase sigma factor (sigma-70 family)